MTTVCNVKVAHIRPLGYESLRDWIADPNNVYIGRGNVVFIGGRRFPPQGSIWASPYHIGRDGTRAEVLANYRRYIVDKLARCGELRQELKSLRGKCLGCWCVECPTTAADGDIQCHGQILMQLLGDV